MNRVFLDANVLLTGAICPGTFAHGLSLHRSGLSFYTSNSCLREAETVIARHAYPELAVAAIDSLNHFLQSLGCFVTVDQDVPGLDLTGVSKTDRHAYTAAVASGADVLCTYNIKDFSGGAVEVRSPLGIMRSVGDPQRFMIQYPCLGEAGTLMLLTRQYGDDHAGVLAGSDDVVITQRPDRSISVEGDGMKEFRPTGHRVPDGYAHALVLRYRADGEFEVSAWLLGEQLPDDLAVGSSGKVALASGRAAFGHPVTPGLSLGRLTGPSGEVFGVSGVPRWVSDTNMRTQALVDQCLEGVAESKGIAEALRSVLHVSSEVEGRFLEIPGIYRWAVLP